MKIFMISRKTNRVLQRAFSKRSTSKCVIVSPRQKSAHARPLTNLTFVSSEFLIVEESLKSRPLEIVTWQVSCTDRMQGSSVSVFDLPVLLI